MIANGAFSPQQPDLFRPVATALLEGGDSYLLLADYVSYIECQQRVAQAYRDERSLVQMSIRNVAGMGKFSTDRTIREYAEEIWSVKAVSPL
jgi:glycogen phosphorylase